MEFRLDVEIRERLAGYLAKQISLDEFKEWFIPATWEVEETGDRLSYDLSNEIHLRLAEFSNGHWTDDELRRIFSPLMETYSVNISFGSAMALDPILYSTSSETYQHPGADIGFSVACA